MGPEPSMTMETESATSTQPSQTAELLEPVLELYEKGNLQDAEAACRRALSISSASGELHRTLGRIVHDQHRVDEAVAHFEEAVRLNPTNPDGLTDLALSLGEQGRMSEALAAAGRALEIAPNHLGALYHLTQMKAFSAGDPDLLALEKLAGEENAVSEESTHFLYFALAKAYEDVGDYDRAFTYLEQANTLRRKQVKYNVEEDIRVMDETAQVFTDALLSSLGSVGSESELPILIVGMPRSGTTLVEQILASHPAVHGAGELELLRQLAVAVGVLNEEGAVFPAGALHLGADDFRRLGEGYVGRLQALAPDATRITDKLPFNFLYLGMARLMLPRASIIHCVRDPIDTCLSCYKSNFATVPVSFDLEDLGRYYRAYEKLMAHWSRTLPPGSILEVNYERLVDDVEQGARQIISHCGLEWDDRCLDFHSTKRVVQTWSFAQVRRPIYRNAIGRWRRYENHLGPLVAGLSQ